MGIGRATSVDGEEWQGVMRKVTFTPDGNEAQGLIRPQHCGLTPLFSERYFSHFCVNPRPVTDGRYHGSFERSDGIYIYTYYLNIQIQFCIPNFLFFKVFFF